MCTLCSVKSTARAVLKIKLTVFHCEDCVLIKYYLDAIFLWKKSQGTWFSARFVGLSLKFQWWTLVLSKVQHLNTSSPPGLKLDINLTRALCLGRPASLFRFIAKFVRFLHSLRSLCHQFLLQKCQISKVFAKFIIIVFAVFVSCGDVLIVVILWCVKSPVYHKIPSQNLQN